MTPLDLDHVERARLFLAINEALDIPRDPETQRERARVEYALAMSDRSGEPVELFASIAVADDIAQCTKHHDHRVTAEAVATAYKIEVGTARRALLLAGWIRDTTVKDMWISEYGASKIWEPVEADLFEELFNFED